MIFVVYMARGSKKHWHDTTTLEDNTEMTLDMNNMNIFIGKFLINTRLVLLAVDMYNSNY